MSYTTLKAVLLVTTGFFFHSGIVPPNSPPSTTGTAFKGQLFEYVVRVFAYGCNTMVLCGLFSHIISLGILAFHDPVYTLALEYLCPVTAPSLTRLTHTSIALLSGAGLVVLGSALRIWCYRTLGKLFTFEVVLENNHSLVTSGPYAYVRHPSYTAMCLMLLGISLVGFSDGSYIAECGIMMTQGKWVVRFWQACTIYTIVALYKRGHIEDGRLRDRFGHLWYRYTADVPCMFIPYLV